MSLTAEQWDEAVLLYTEHEWDTVELSEHFGITRQAMARGLVRRGVAMRASTQAAPQLRIKQCTRCLHFLPVGLFSWSGTANKRRLQSQCIDCTNQRESDRWTVDVQPLAAALGNWRMQ